MRRNALLFVPLLVLAVVIQTSIISRMKLLEGNADLIMLLLAAWGLQESTKGSWIWGILGATSAGLVSGIPFYIYAVGYLVVVGFSQLIKRKIWEAPLLAMFLLTIIGTFSLLLLSYLQISLFSIALPFGGVFGVIILPSLLLNLLFSIPVHATISNMVKRLLPQEVRG